MLKILNAEPDGYSPQAYEILSGIGTVDSRNLTRPDLLSSLKDYDALIVRLGHRVDQEVLDQAPRLKVIVTATTGLNHIALEEAQKRNIAVLCLRGETAFLDSVCATAEHTMALMLALLRHLPAAAGDVKAGYWRRDLFKGMELNGRTLGIIGYGRLGRKIARYAHSFGMSVLAHDTRTVEAEAGVTMTALHDLLSDSDIISLHASHIPGNPPLLGADHFTMMKPGALFINTARGELVDEAALLAQLSNGHLAGAALDVLQDENRDYPSWTEKNALVSYAKAHDNLIITPHIGGATFDSMEKTEIFMARKLKLWAGNM